jgi:hypothetical protein
MTTLAQQVNPRHRALLNASLRDYRSGFPDRAGNFLQDLVTSFIRDPEYAAAFSPAGQKRLQGFITDLKDVH